MLTDKKFLIETILTIISVILIIIEICFELVQWCNIIITIILIINLVLVWKLTKEE